MNPETPDQARNPENHDNASTPKQASPAQRADQALRAAADRVRAWLAPLLERFVQWLAPLLRRVQDAPVVRRFRERVAPHVAAVQEKLPEPVVRASRTRSMQAGAAVAAVGVVGLVIGTAAAGSSDPQVEEAAVAAPMQSAPEQQVALEQQATLQQQPTPQQVEPQAAPAPEPEAPLGPPVEGIDVSNHNGNIDWSQVAADGKKFTFVLATDGTSFTNPKYSEQYHGAKDAGLIAGAYHFARPSSSSGEAQADRFLDVADYQSDGKTLPPVLDLEVDPNSGGCYGMSVDEMHQWTQAFNDRVQERTGKEPIIYANPSFWRQCMGSTDSFDGHPLWLASYGVDSPSVPNGFSNWHFWQYTDKGDVAGISGNTDLNLFQEGMARLEKLAR
ncbi:GH25 family lysozyme [Saccharopolyspora sp. NPDC000359]|uniref:GH25 family lysozyme n=1 Tax=Saccharopolyspora sp. NPDC000359 TaxID=3154251 RepID=UPI00332A8B51